MLLDSVELVAQLCDGIVVLFPEGDDGRLVSNRGFFQVSP